MTSSRANLSCVRARAGLAKHKFARADPSLRECASSFILSLIICVDAECFCVGACKPVFRYRFPSQSSPAVPSSSLRADSSASRQSSVMESWCLCPPPSPSIGAFHLLPRWLWPAAIAPANLTSCVDTLTFHIWANCSSKSPKKQTILACGCGHALTLSDKYLFY